MIATPKIDTKPTAAEMLKFVLVSHKAQTPPIESATTSQKTKPASSQERKAK